MRLGERLRRERLRRHLSQEALAEALGISVKSIGRWEQGRAIPQGYARLQLSRFFSVSPEELFADLEAQTSPALLWTVPFSRNPYFTGREEILQSLHTRLTSSQPVALTQTLALSGLGGIGKTQVAIEYAYRYVQEYSAIFWLAAETSESLMASLQLIADQLQLSERQEAKQSRTIAAVQRWLMTHTGWLLIADNVEDLDLLQTILPSVRRGALLLTTRRQALGALAEPLELLPMSSEEGVTLILRRARWFNTPISDSVMQQESLQGVPIPAGAADLVMYLEGLPLALDQAGAYIEETGCGVADYLQRCREQRKQVLAHRGIYGGTHPASVAATLKLSLEQAEHEHPAAADLLRMCAFLHPEAIPEELFRTGVAHLGPVLDRIAADSYQFDLALTALRSVSLLKRQAGTQTFAVHRLVQAVLQDDMDPAETRLWSKRVIRAVNAAFPEKTDELDTWPQCERYLMHAQACVPWIELTEGDFLEAGELLFKIGSYLTTRGRIKEAEPLLAQAVALGERQRGPDHPALIPLLSKQGELYWFLGKYDQSRAVLYRLLALEEQHLGPTHPQVITTLDNLATALREQEKYEQAEQLYQRVLHMGEQQWGPEHPKVAETLDNLAILYWNQGKDEQAEPLYQRAIHIQEQHLGPEHPRTAITLQNLATLYRNQGNYEQAEPLYQRALHIREQQLGPEHPAVATTLNSLATL
ncbi:MAG TPA: FxSxx-COOH system tetratricopeptide repeat protein, partial [Ktedonobacteraceae bacterium]